jgi:hypothetical protein
MIHVNLGPVLAMVQALSGVSRRSMGQATNVLVTNLGALPLGPLLVGLSSDYLAPSMGTSALGYSIMWVVVVALSLSAWHFFRTATTLKKDLEEASAN